MPEVLTRRRGGIGAVVRARPKTMIALVLAVAVLGVLAFGIGRWLGGSSVVQPPVAAQAPAAAPPADSTPSGVTPAGFTEFADPGAGFALSYPTDWPKQPVGDPNVKLLVANGASESLLVRVVQLDAPVTADNLDEARKVTDQVVKPSDSITLLAQPTRVDFGGLPGLFYFYSFKDSSTGAVGAHSHVFLFKGKEMISLVGQALPAERFKDIAPVLDKVFNSFRVLS